MLLGRDKGVCGERVSMLAAFPVVVLGPVQGMGVRRASQNPPLGFTVPWNFFSMWAMQHFPGGNPKGGIVFLRFTPLDPGLPFRL